MLKAIEEELTAGDARWAAWLSDLLLAANVTDSAARPLKARALSALACLTENPVCRHWYLSDAGVLNGSYRPPKKPVVDLQTVDPVPIEELLRTLPQRLRPEKTARLTMSIGFEFTDTGKQFTFFIRQGVGE